MSRRPARADLTAAALAAGGVLLLFTYPLHRLDMVIYGVLGGAGGMAWRPRLSPLLVGLALPLYFFSRDFGPVAITPPVLVLVLAWLGVGIRAAWEHVRGRVPPFAWPRSAYAVPVGLFLLGALLSLLVTQYPRLSLRELRALVVEPLLFFWLLRTLRPLGPEPWAIGGFLIAASLAAMTAFVQLGLGLGGTEAEGVRRAQAWYPSPNHLALMLGRALPFALALALARPRRLPNATGWLVVILVGVALLASFSVGGWLGGVAAILAVIAAMRPGRIVRRLGAGLLGTGVLVAALAVIGVLPERLNPLRATGTIRVELWRSSVDMVRDHPLLGIGLDNFPYLYQQVYIREGGLAEPNLSHPHNWPLHVWLEIGLAGLAAFLWLLLRFGGQVRSALARAPTPWIAAGALGAMAHTLAHGLVDNSYFLPDLAFLFWLALAAAEAAREGRSGT